MQLCRRFVPVERAKLTLQKRAEDDTGLPKIIGTAAVFFRENDTDNTQYQLWSDTWERVLPTAFDGIADDDVRALANHDPRLLLGRSTAGTLRLKVTKTGLEYEVDTADNTAGRDTVVSLERGDMTGSSFAFYPVETTWTEEETTDGWRYFRNLEAVATEDVSPVTFPAYLGATSGTRGSRSACPGLTGFDRRSVDAELEAIRTELQSHLQEHYHAPKLRARERERRLKLLSLSV